ncbi:MAG TPA: hypothetical protein VFG43_12460 [Geminicoccaceae bacterium]|nr:hypothetical protein [Geminicoccaceae bacterium]
MSGVWRRRLVRGLFLLLSSASLALAGLQASRLADAWLAGGPPAYPADDRAVQDTILVALAEAAARGEFDARIRAELRPDGGSPDDEAVARAELFLALALRLGVALEAETLALHAEETTLLKRAGRLGRQCARGFGTGTGLSPAALACAAAGDLVLWGDIRDLARESWQAWRGEPIDPVILGLAGAGLGVTALTVGTGGVAAPARVGASAAKVAAKAGRLGARRLGSADELAEMARLGRLSTPARAVKYADTAEELRFTGRLARIFGKDTDAVLELLGKRVHLLFRTTKLGWRKLVELGGVAAWMLGSVVGLAGSLAGGGGNRWLKRWVLRRL